MNALTFAQSLVSVSKAPVRKKYSRIDYRDSDGEVMSKYDLADMYGIGQQSVTRAFSKFHGDYVKANEYLNERHLVPITDRMPDTYVRRDYRDQEGNSISRKECAEIMGLDPHYLGKLYDKYEDDWKFIYENHGLTRVNPIIRRPEVNYEVMSKKLF